MSLTVHKFKTYVTVEAEVEFSVLPELEEHGLPEQIDITAVIVDVINPKTRKIRRTNIVDALSETEMLNLEEEIEAEEL